MPFSLVEHGRLSADKACGSLHRQCNPKVTDQGCSVSSALPRRSLLRTETTLHRRGKSCPPRRSRIECSIQCSFGLHSEPQPGTAAPKSLPPRQAPRQRRPDLNTVSDAVAISGAATLLKERSAQCFAPPRSVSGPGTVKTINATTTPTAATRTTSARPPSAPWLRRDSGGRRKIQSRPGVRGRVPTAAEPRMKRVSLRGRPAGCRSELRRGTGSGEEHGRRLVPRV